MKRIFSLGLLLSAAVLIGCAVSPTATSNQPAGNWVNWQIQTGAALTSPPNTYPSMVGAVQVSGSNVNAVFTILQSAQTSEVEDFAGSYTASSGNISVSTFGYGIDYVQPASPYTLVPVTLIGGCVYPPGYTGVECDALVAFSPAVGAAIAPLNGLYTGTLTDAAISGYSGTATLTLTQSTAPNASGQFPLTGTITFPAGSGLPSASLSGTVNGEAVAMNWCSAAVSGPCIALTGSTVPAGNQIVVSSLVYNQPAANLDTTFTGTLNLQ